MTVEESIQNVALKNNDYIARFVSKFVDEIYKENELSPSYNFNIMNQNSSGEFNQNFVFALKIQYENNPLLWVRVQLKFDDIMMRDGGNPKIQVKICGFYDKAPRSGCIVEIESYKAEFDYIKLHLEILSLVKRLYKEHLHIDETDNEKTKQLRKEYHKFKKLKEEAEEELVKANKQFEEKQAIKRSVLSADSRIGLPYEEKSPDW